MQSCALNLFSLSPFDEAFDENLAKHKKIAHTLHAVAVILIPLQYVLPVIRSRPFFLLSFTLPKQLWK